METGTTMDGVTGLATTGIGIMAAVGAITVVRSMAMAAGAVEMVTAAVTETTTADNPSHDPQYKRPSR
jgi:hypothetical protein